jgi:AcrR family transcriptional regulator
MARAKVTKPVAARENKKAAQSEVTRGMIMDAAEKMIAKDGVEGVSLRQIRVAIGSAHTNVVTYHFGNKEALIRAIILDRQAVLERRRAELLATARKRGLGDDLAALTHAVWYPLFELTNAEGRHTYAAFQVGVDWGRRRAEMRFPVEHELGDLIAAQLPEEARNFFTERIAISYKMIAGALEYCDDLYAANPIKSKRLFEIAIRMGAAALATP